MEDNPRQTDMGEPATEPLPPEETLEDVYVRAMEMLTHIGRVIAYEKGLANLKPFRMRVEHDMANLDVSSPEAIAYMEGRV